MSSLHRKVMYLEEVDYPVGGILADGWDKLSPETPNFWRAYNAVCTNLDSKRYFLGAGYTDLETTSQHLEDLFIICVCGFAYVFNDLRVSVLPTHPLGYSCQTVGENVVTFNNYSELLLLNSQGVVRYDSDAAVDDLEVISLGENRVVLAGIRRLGEEQSEWVIDFNDIPYYSG